MLQRIGGNLRVRKMPAPSASEHLEREGYAHVRSVLTPDEIAALHAEISGVFAASGIDRERDAKDEFRYGMLNRSALSQKAIASRGILDVIEPLIGEDCHVIANTAWRNAPGHQGGAWHCDAGPHIPRPENVPWPEAVPYPVFAIGVHIFLEDCPMEAGPTAVLPTSHKSGRLPPKDRLWDLDLSFDNKLPVFLPAKAGDAILFVSDLWHRGTPAQSDKGRFFLQCHYGRRDIAQRIEGTMDVNHLSPEAIARAETDRDKTLIGLHGRYFYDG